MAERPVRIITKRTSVPGKIPTGTTGTELNLIKTGELASNLTDKKLFSYDGTSVFEFGTNSFLALTGGTITGNLNVIGKTQTTNFQMTSGATNGYVLTSDAIGNASWQAPTGGGSSVFTGGTVSGDTIFLAELSARTITLDTTYTGTTNVGEISWNLDFGIPQVGMFGGNVVQKIGESVYAYVKNVDTTTLNKGEVVYIFGASGDKISVKRASATGDTTSSKTLGIVAESIGVNQLGYIITQGTLDGLNLGSYTPGDILWLSTTPGQFTNLKQYAPVHLVFIGVVQRANNGNGQLYVKPQNGYELDELHNVVATGATNGDLIVYNDNTSLWETSKTLTGNYSIKGDLTITGNTLLQAFTGTSGQVNGVLNVNGNLVVSGNTGVNWFSGSSSSDLVRITQAGSGNAFVVEDSSTPDSTPFTIDASGNVGIGIGSSDPLWSTNTKLQVYTSGSTQRGIRIRETSTNSSFNFWSFTAGTANNRILRLDEDTTGTNVMSWSNNGNVGIGTSSPSSRLTIITTGSTSGSFPAQSGSTQTGDIARLRNGGTNLVLDIGGFSSNGNWLQSTNQTDLSLTYPLLLNPNGGKVGVNLTSPSESLHVSGNTIVTGNITASNLLITGSAQSIFSGNSSSDLVRITQTGSGNAFVVEDSVNPDSTPFVIDASGNVGIGTSSPREKLDVSGNTIVSGSISGATIAITSLPTSGYTSTQILMRNSTSGQVEITDSTSPSIYNYGMSYAISTFNFLT